MFAIISMIFQVAIGHGNDGPRIIFQLNLGTAETHGKIAYQDEYRYEVLLDQYGRPCPTGRYSKRQLPNTLAGGIETNRDLLAFSVIPPTSGFYLFGSGRLVYYTLISGEGASRIYAPDLNKRISSIEDYLQGNEVRLRQVRSYRSVFDQLPADDPKHRDLFLLPGFFSAIKGSDVNMRNARTLSDYPKQPRAFAETKPANAKMQAFVPDYLQRYAIRFQRLIYTVTIDKTSGEYRFEDFSEKINAANIPRPELPPWLFQPKSKDESVYELRQGRLIPGFLAQISEEEWLFVPDMGGTIIDAAEYLRTYQPWSRRIYNLPGKFVLKSEK